MRKYITRILFGIAVIALAVVILLNAFEVIDLGNIRLWDFWPAILIIAGIGTMLSDRVNVWNLSLTLVGVFLFCLQMGWLQSNLAKTVLICILLIALGIWLIVGWIWRERKRKKIPEDNNYEYNQQTVYENGYREVNRPESNQHRDEGDSNNSNFNYGGANDGQPGGNGQYQQGYKANTPPYDKAPVNDGSSEWQYETAEFPQHSSVFSYSRIYNASQSLKGGKLSAVFGGLEINFSDAVPNSNIDLTAASVFGNVTIIVPRNSCVRIEGTPVLGRCDNYVPYIDSPYLPLITIKYTAVFGNVEIRN